MKILPPKSHIVTDSSNTEDVTENYKINQYPIPNSSSYYQLSPIDLYEKLNLKDQPISYDYDDYKYKNYHQNTPNYKYTNTNHILAALLVDKKKNQIATKPYFYNPPEVRRKYSGNQIKNVSKFNEEFKI